ncbi:MAG: porin [Synechococcaceae bacterium WBB_10_009]|jgi:hypothetical protein|nr:porin [Synechococcaceae bacterium WBB_10_009]
MKLFQKLLLAPAALGLMAPVAASAADLNVAGVRQYTTSEEQVTSITQFSDVKPTDWAYQALSNLIERYGCVAGYPNGTYKGGQAMTRWEAAALLNACLDRITEVTDELKRLMKEFEKELAVLKGRVDSLEAKVGELEATQFSTTTKLKGIATFVLGANSFSGTNSGSQFNGTPNTAAYNRAQYGATTFNYDLKLNFDTSFTGKDLLRTSLRAGNFFGANGVANNAYGAGLSFLEAATNQYAGPGGSNVVVANRLFYNFPVGDELSLTAGALVRMDDAGMLGLWPSVYPADTVLDNFTYAGAPGAYNTGFGLGSGAGFVYSPKFAKGLTISQNYVSANAYSGNTGTPNPSGTNSGGGVWTGGASSTAVSQIGYVGEKTPLIGGSYGLAFAYAYSQNMPLTIGTPLAYSYSNIGSGGTSSNNYGLSGYWKPEKAGLVPSFSWGFGGSTFNTGVLYNSSTNQSNSVKGITTASWMIGLQWDDAFIKGNALGMGVGQAPFVTQAGSNAANTPRSNTCAAGQGGCSGAYDSNYMWEWWYKFQVTDNISITPAIYYISNYDGQLGQVNQSTGSTTASDNLFGGLIKTTFKF